MLRAIQEIKPAFVIAENVFGITNIDDGLVFEQVCLDLEAEGYEVQPFVIPAAAKNAPHRRDRVWFIAIGVGNKPASVPSVRSVFGCSWNNKRLNFVPFSFQVKAHLLENQSAINIRDTKDVFCDDVCGLNFLYCSKHFAP